jgi:sugar phosphate permease
LWAVCTVGVGASRTLGTACMFTAANGLGLALVIPCAQSIIADYYPADQRGRAFGAMNLTMAAGSMLGGLFATNVAQTQVRPLFNLKRGSVPFKHC